VFDSAETKSVAKNEEYQKTRQNEATLRSFGSEQHDDPKPKRWNPRRRSRGACGRPRYSPIRWKTRRRTQRFPSAASPSRAAPVPFPSE